MATPSQLLARIIDLFGPAGTAVASKLYGNLMVSPAGNVVVGSLTDDGAHTLQVNGPAKFYGAVSMSGGMTATGGVNFNTVLAGTELDVFFQTGGVPRFYFAASGTSGQTFSLNYCNSSGVFAGQLFSVGQGGAASFYTGLQVSSTGYPLSLTNTAGGGQWLTGPTTSNAFVVYTAGGVGVYVAAGATAWTANSDERLKNIRGEITSAVEAVKSIRTVRYSWKEEDDHAEALGVENDSKVYVGVIAQDVQKVLPEAVSVAPNTYLGVAYSDLTPLALAAIKELSAQLDNALARIAKLEGK